jgi:hypothetical protein
MLLQDAKHTPEGIMSIARLFGGISLLLVSSFSAYAQTTTYVVKSPTADVTSGIGNPSLFYVTNRLKQGDRVEVVKEETGGWLAIKAPTGSVSWINKRFLKPISRDVWSVESEADVEVLYGSEVRKEKPNVRSVYLKRGAQVLRAGETVSADDGNWQMIKSPDTELRYIRIADVAPMIAAGAGQSGQQTSPVTVGRSPSKDYSVPLVPTPATEPQSSANSAWAEAQRAEREDRIRDAIELYNKLGREVANTDHELSMRCFNQASWLQHKPSYAPGNRLQPVAAGTSAAYTPQAGRNPCAPGEYTFYGRLRQARQSVDSKPTFVLENYQGQIVAYITSAGADLNQVVGREVEVTGPAWYCGTVRNNYMKATRVTARQ